jgi:hypothetical protein
MQTTNESWQVHQPLRLDVCAILLRQSHLRLGVLRRRDDISPHRPDLLLHLKQCERVREMAIHTRPQTLHAPRRIGSEHRFELAHCSQVDVIDVDAVLEIDLAPNRTQTH